MGGVQKAIRLGPGDYVQPNSSHVKLDHRELFLEAVAEAAPGVLLDLAGDPFAAMLGLWEREQAAWTEADNARPVDGGHRYHNFGQAAMYNHLFHENRFLHGQDSGEKRVHDLVVQWADHWHLVATEDDWIFLEAIRTLKGWAAKGAPHRDPDGGRLSWAGHVQAVKVHLTDAEMTIWLSELVERDELEPEQITECQPLPRWNPQLGVSRAELRDRLVRRIDAELDRIEAIAIERGLEESRAKLPAGSPTDGKPGDLRPDRHYRWFVQRQVLGDQWGEIAEVANAGDKAVKSAVRDVAKALGLRLDPGKPGRPVTR